MLYYVYGYYSHDHDRGPEILEWFDCKREAEEFAEDFSRIPGRIAWVKEE